jgi:hypothetical protein
MQNVQRLYSVRFYGIGLGIEKYGIPGSMCQDGD